MKPLLDPGTGTGHSPLTSRHGSRTPPSGPHKQRGAALLLALLTAALAATLSASGYWQQWQAWQIEQSERQRVQSAWLLTGALDWARLILREDARASQIDHLAEPWSVPLQESRLNTFLAAQEQNPEALLTESFLSGRIHDMQARMNLRNLVEGSGQNLRLSGTGMASFAKLFQALGLPQEDLLQFSERLLRTLQAGQGAALLPQHFEQLQWLGLSPATLQRMADHATWLPERTALNLNTSSELALYASVPGLDRAQAQRLVQQRERSHFTSLEQAAPAFGSARTHINAERFTLSSRYFLLHGQLRLDELTVQERSLVLREGINVRTIWRQRGGAPVAPRA
ncbi:type II secretory pathway, component PulK [Serpentinimonas raichei]|uniref:Type II secretion system protein K n=1 Tax=Serpentinimonas raichei TaxID=1458425 RepID=A0A060NHM1_9BURK|nr:type II secretion system minor pseudopilin GspK [Serpentinimonas raichei]BAO80245.1 type II secretory pathway, component PulK [Serpentinimonas raichei]